MSGICKIKNLVHSVHPNAHYRQLWNQLRKCGYIICVFIKTRFEPTFGDNIVVAFFPHYFIAPANNVQLDSNIRFFSCTWILCWIDSKTAETYAERSTQDRSASSKNRFLRWCRHCEKCGGFLFNVGMDTFTFTFTQFFQSQEVAIYADIVSESQRSYYWYDISVNWIANKFSNSQRRLTGFLGNRDVSLRGGWKSLAALLGFSGGSFACFWGQFGSEVAPNMEPRTCPWKMTELRWISFEKAFR